MMAQTLSIKELKQQHYSGTSKEAQHYYGHGKLLLFGEYFVMDGAQALSVPTVLGQSLNVRYSPSFNPTLFWKSFDYTGELWFEAKMEFWHFDLLGPKDDPIALVLQKILRQARSQNTHFLRDEFDVYVETQLEFPLEWGLGSSSTLIHNIAKWAYVSPFEIQFKTFGGSGYDIAQAQSDGPLLYSKTKKGPHWSPIEFNPSFCDQLYFVYSGVKQKTHESLKQFESYEGNKKSISQNISELTNQAIVAQDLETFECVMDEHEKLISSELGLSPIKDQCFKDYWGAIKSLGAWGGDFYLVSSNRSLDETKHYFLSKGYNQIFPYYEMVLKTPTQRGENVVH